MEGDKVVLLAVLSLSPPSSTSSSPRSFAGDEYIEQYARGEVALPSPKHGHVPPVSWDVEGVPFWETVRNLVCGKLDPDVHSVFADSRGVGYPTLDHTRPEPSHWPSELREMLETIEKRVQQAKDEFEDTVATWRERCEEEKRERLASVRVKVSFEVDVTDFVRDRYPAEASTGDLSKFGKFFVRAQWRRWAMPGDKKQGLEPLPLELEFSGDKYLAKGTHLWLDFVL